MPGHLRRPFAALIELHDDIEGSAIHNHRMHFPLEQIHTRTARILQGYDHMSYVLHHTAGKFVTQEDNGKLTMMFERHNRGSYFDLEVKIDKISELKLLYSPSSIEHMDLPPLDEKPPPFEFGYADPAAITFFDNILFYGDRMFNVSTRSQISSVHPIINYVSIQYAT
ncbi:hypothetical protein L596_020383 [Steinernema carpocapsae]|uniref:Uncharacterized protein n=1 Tax=Steinernema carpocapsae TaxID=34508 RepID=A0A4V6A0W8_STECR|nr:hypothetical protein L596_020383 [Steinernema carpocapsae]